MIGETSSAGYTYRKVYQMLSKDNLSWVHLRPWSYQSWYEASKTIWDSCWLQWPAEGGWDDDPGHPRQEGHPKSETLSQTHGAYHEHKNIKSLRITVSASQPFLIRTFVPLLILELFIPPLLHNSAGWLKVLKHNFCDDSDRTLWVEP